MEIVRVLPSLAPRPAPPREDYNVDVIAALAFVPGGSDLVVAGRFQLARWSLDLPRPRWALAHAGRWGVRACITPDGARLYTNGVDGQLIERDPATGAERRCLDPGCHITAALVASADGRALAWAGSSVPSNPGGYARSEARLYDVATGDRRWAWSGTDWASASGVTFLREDALIVTVNSDGIELRRDDGVPRAHHAFADGLQVVAIRRGHAIVLVRDAVGRAPAALELRSGAGFRRRRDLAIPIAEPMAVDAPGRLAAVAGTGPEVAIVSLKRMQVIETIRLPDPDLDRPTALAFTDGLLAVGTVGGQVYVLAPRALTAA